MGEAATSDAPVMGPKFGTGITRRRVKDYAEKGLSNAEIARVLEVSRETVRKHIERLRRDGELPSEEATG